MSKIINMLIQTEPVIVEHDQLSNWQLIHVVSVLPAGGTCSP